MQALHCIHLCIFTPLPYIECAKVSSFSYQIRHSAILGFDWVIPKPPHSSSTGKWMVGEIDCCLADFVIGQTESRNYELIVIKGRPSVPKEHRWPAPAWSICVWQIIMWLTDADMCMLHMAIYYWPSLKQACVVPVVIRHLFILHRWTQYKASNGSHRIYFKI